MQSVLITGLFLPLAGFIFMLLFSSHLSRKVCNIVGPATVFGAFLCFLTLLYTNVTLPDITLFMWIPVEGINAGFTLHLDHLSLLMTLIITGVGFLIHVYSCGYMEHDKDYARYFAVMNFFIFSMLLLVLSANLLLLFVGWEGVGVASYLLIGFWYQRDSAQKAAKKAFIVNRIGDLGLLLGIFLTLALFGTSDMHAVNSMVATNFASGAPIITLLALLYFWGACGKSAQMPLHTWLPDAMEGPTPVSALIHAATMVTAGVYLVVRMHPVFEVSHFALMVVAIVGLTTSLFSAFCATSQTDIKRVLAYSTLSQLGLMFMACGFSAYFAAMFQLTMHAFVKALLFLAAGNVIHMLHDVTEMSSMGGLARYLKKTNVFFLIGALSMAGIPPLAIFFSKDLILEDVSGWFYLLGLIVSLLTAFYMTRAYFLTFQGPKEYSSLKDAPRIMMLPVALLGVLSFIGGFLGFSIGAPPAFMQYLGLLDVSLLFGYHVTGGLLISVLVAITGVIVGATLYKRYSCTFFYKAFYINELYEVCIVKPMRGLSRLVAYFFEPKVFDSSLKKAATTSYMTATGLQEMQSGNIRSYIAWIIAGTCVVVLYLVFEGFS